MRIAVVGGGLFGCTAAIELAKAGHDVELFEARDRLFAGASSINHQRLHKGYHYPRAPETVQECRKGLSSFKQAYGAAVIQGDDTFYGVAKVGSKLSSAEYLAFCETQGLPYKIEKPISKALSVMVRVKEARVDPLILRNLAMIQMAKLGVITYRSTRASVLMRDEYDQIVLAGYGASNELALEFGLDPIELQYEVVENPLIRLPEHYRDFSIVVMDGPFCSLAAYGNTGLHLLGHVECANHTTWVGTEPDVPGHLAGYINAGMIVEPDDSRLEEMIAASVDYLPFLDDAIHVGSLFTVRAVLPDQEETDSRPTLVDRLDPQVLRIFSGKIGTAVLAAREVSQLVQPSRHRMGGLLQAAG